MPRQEFFLWQVHSFTVRVALDIVDKLNYDLADPRRKADEEHGGILFGRIRGDKVVEVTGFEFLHSEHRRGTLYDLGARERQRVARYIGDLEKRPGDKPVGYFRTHRRPGLFLDQDDFALMNEAFAAPYDIALVIRPEYPGPPNAGIFFWEDGDIDRRQTHLLFPFDAKTLRTQGPVETSQDTPPARQPAIDKLRPLLNVKLPNISRPLVGWTAAVCLAAIAVAMLLPRGHSGRSSDNPLNLHVSRTGQALLVDWDRDAPVVRHASSAVLSIEDGGATQQLNLNHSDLEHGSV
ncbi:MAG TPA: hypothetical protein VHB50_09515, partial [Bryobacteraceae bacterium]|nr:hypothetical protein [Bryobacteraceae bacterium]